MVSDCALKPKQRGEISSWSLARQMPENRVTVQLIGINPHKSASRRSPLISYKPVSGWLPVCRQFYPESSHPLQTCCLDYNYAHPCPLPLVPNSVHTRSLLRSAQAEWAKSTGPATLVFDATWRSRSCHRHFHLTPTACAVLSRRRSPPPP